MLENIRKKVDYIAKAANQPRTVSANIEQIVNAIQDIMAKTDLLVTEKREDHLFIFGDKLEAYINDEFEKDLMSTLEKLSTPSSHQDTISLSELISASCNLLGNKVVGTLYQFASDFWISECMDEEFVQALTPLLKKDFQVMVDDHTEQVARKRTTSRTVYATVGAYTSSLMWMLWQARAVVAPTSLWVSAFLSLIIPITALRSCGIPWQFRTKVNNINTAMVASVLKQERSEIIKVCRQSVKKWLMTACRPEQVILDEITRDVGRMRGLSFSVEI